MNYLQQYLTYLTTFEGVLEKLTSSKLRHKLLYDSLKSTIILGRPCMYPTKQRWFQIQKGDICQI